MANNNLLLQNIIEGIKEKKGLEIIDLDLTKVQNSICDHFIICHANSNTQVSAIADSIEKKVKENLNQRVDHREGIENAMWILLDYTDVVVHVFQKEYRDYYCLEELWGDAHISRIEENYK
ncbi:Ribosomal silencing factor RsfS [subsurface metagenome]